MSKSNITNNNNTASQKQAKTLINTSVPFAPLAMLKEQGKPRKAVFLWLIFIAIIIPSSVITRYLEWTGIELSLGSMSFYFTIYIPMLFCVPLVFWYGFIWAAIPAYFSTFLVAYIGGMPVPWIILFSLANPLSLALYTLSYQVIRSRPRMEDLFSFIGFVLISFTATLAGSAGSFIWAYANKVGLNDALPVWQGWWFGGWLQAMLLVLPLLHFAGPSIERWLAPLKLSDKVKDSSYKNLTLATLSFVLILVGYVVAARFISIEQFNTIKQALPNDSNLMNIQNAIDGLSYPLYILLAVMLAVTYLVYRTIIFWQQVLLNANLQLTEKNNALEKLATIDHLSKLFNRRKVLDLAITEFNRTRRNGNSLSILMIDIDRFKRINDEFGHLIGDAAIYEVASRLHNTLRPYDYSGRYGGEEFIAILPETDSKNALQIAKRILLSISGNPVSTEKGELDVSVSIGVTSFLETDNDLTEVIERADQALLNAKNNGRNCVKFSK